jgi:hypothetical protein
MKTYKKRLTKLVYSVILLLVFTAPLIAAGKYELKIRRDANRISLEIIDILEKTFLNKKWRGVIYVAPSDDATVRRVEMMHDIRDNQKVFVIRIIYYF